MVYWLAVKRCDGDSTRRVKHNAITTCMGGLNREALAGRICSLGINILTLHLCFCTRHRHEQHGKNC